MCRGSRPWGGAAPMREPTRSQQLSGAPMRRQLIILLQPGRHQNHMWPWCERRILIDFAFPKHNPIILFPGILVEYCGPLLVSKPQQFSQVGNLHPCSQASPTTYQEDVEPELRAHLTPCHCLEPIHVSMLVWCPWQDLLHGDIVKGIRAITLHHEQKVANKRFDQILFS